MGGLGMSNRSWKTEQYCPSPPLHYYLATLVNAGQLDNTGPKSVTFAEDRSLYVFGLYDGSV